MTEASAPIEAHTDEAQTPPSVFDVAVIGSGPAGSQSAVSAAHQTRSVLVIEAGHSGRKVSNSRMPRSSPASRAHASPRHSPHG